MTGRLATPLGIMHGVATVSWQSQLFLPSGRRLTSSGNIWTVIRVSRIITTAKQAQIVF